ncbi:MAG TPA: right-handed parallel beta-helix repeat-containing protein [Verrucomicrobiae bacterium]|jgi:hypothetical protein|nr:right-handed parallel beta-helix repeat-containing protein [Verrucomicrobiae bacterium]
MLNTKYLSIMAVLAMATAAKANNAIVATIQAAKSGTTVTVSGTYTGITTRIQVPSGVKIQGPATFVFTTGASADGFYIPAGDTGVTLNSLTVQGANHGIMCYGGSSTINSCISEGNQNTGIELIGSSAKNDTVSNCQGKQNADAAGSGGNADGFGCKQGTGSGNKFTGCDAHQNSDDGYDFEKASSPVTATSCQSYNNGNYAGLTGNGDGFKMGISGDNTANVYTSCIAHDNTLGDTADGFDQNDNAGKIHLTTCHSYNNKQKDRLTNVTLTNCTMQQ